MARFKRGGLPLVLLLFLSGQVLSSKVGHRRLESLEKDFKVIQNHYLEVARFGK